MISEKSENHHPFLAMTALEAFWDASYPVIFLGEWCRRYSRRTAWEQLGNTIIKSPWSDEHELKKATAYVESQYNLLLNVLSIVLNKFHNVNHSERYWRILLGPWLQLYVPAIYDRYRLVIAALQQYPDLTTILLDEKSYVTPRDTASFARFVSSDSYNLQIFSCIFRFLDKKFPSKPAEFYQAQSHCPKPRGMVSLLMAAKPLLNKLTYFLRKKAVILTRESYFPWYTELKLVIKTRFKVFPFLEKCTVNTIYPPIRSELKVSINSNETFDRLLETLIISDIPKCFVEEYEQYQQFASRADLGNTSAILSAISWYYDESFKYITATAAERGVALLGIQHGGAYGSHLMHHGEKHEVAITDRYYSWGWDKKNSNSIFPMPAVKLINNIRKSRVVQNGSILFVPTVYPRYLPQFPGKPEYFCEYLIWQERFVNSCTKQVLDKLMVRFRWDDLGWDIEQRWREILPTLCIDSYDRPLVKSLKSCQVFVSDNNQTTFLEALSLNIPSVLFWDREINKIRPEAAPHYDRLRAAGILYDSPEEAAIAVASIFDRTASWWFEPRRQEAVQSFCQMFARTSPHAISEWGDELNKVART